MGEEEVGQVSAHVSVFDSNGSLLKTQLFPLDILRKIATFLIMTCYLYEGVSVGEKFSEVNKWVMVMSHFSQQRCRRRKR